MELHLFGAATPTGEAFRQLAATADLPLLLHAYSRRSATTPADFINPSGFGQRYPSSSALDQLWAHLVACALP